MCAPGSCWKSLGTKLQKLVKTLGSSLEEEPADGKGPESFLVMECF